MSSKRKTTRTWPIKVIDNKSITICNAILSEAFFRKYGFEKRTSEQKSKGIDLRRLIKLLVTYKLGDNFSILRVHDFIMRPEIHSHFGLGKFSVGRIIVNN